MSQHLFAAIKINKTVDKTVALYNKDLLTLENVLANIN